MRSLGTIPANTLDRNFHAPRPNAKWVADFTYIWTLEGWLYVAVVHDLAMNARVTSELVADAQIVAIWRRSATRAR